MDEKKKTQPRANYYRRKTKDYFIALGYYCEYAERYTHYFDPKTGRVGHQKIDLFGADVIAKNIDETLYVNSMVNRSGISEHIKRFNRYPWPRKQIRSTKCVCGMTTSIAINPTERPLIMLWTPRAKEPEIIEVPIGQEEAPQKTV